MNDEKLTLFGTLKYLNQFFDNLKFKFILFYIGRLICMLEDTVVPILVAIMINQIVYYGNIDIFINVGVLFFTVSLFSCIVYYLTYELYSDFWGKITMRVRKAMYNTSLFMNAEDMANANYGDMSQLIQWQATECADFLVRRVLLNINNIVNIVVCLCIVFNIDLLIGVVFSIMIPISVLISMKFGKKVRKEKKKNKKIYGKYINWLYEVFGLFTDIRLLSSEEYTKKKFLEYQDVLIDTDVKAGMAKLTSKSIIANSKIIIQMILFAVIVYVTISSGVMVGTVMMLLSYFTNISKKLQLVCENHMSSQNSIATIERIKEMLSIPLVDVPINAKSILIKNGCVEFSNVSFAYTGKENIINDLNLKIDNGEKIAIVGESGCGKTTLTYMLLGFYKAQYGKVIIDNNDINLFSLESLRNQIGVVQQEVLIFEGSVRENIMAGRPYASEEEMISACKAAGVDEFVKTLPERYDTILGRKGRELSGGQKQRIAIARIYLKNPAIIIFDEATAALDKETENQIHENWKKVLNGRTAIVIAHRLSAVVLCDRVALMENGRIVEEGTPEYMMSKSIRFRRLFAIGGF